MVEIERIGISRATGEASMTVVGPVEEIRELARAISTAEDEAAGSGRERSPVPTCRCPLIDVGSTYHEYVLGRRDEGCPFHGTGEEHG